MEQMWILDLTLDLEIKNFSNSVVKDIMRQMSKKIDLRYYVR